MERQAEGNYYLIKHLTLFTGLTDRTIRSHIASGILQGEKINGLWHFNSEQVEAFLRHPAVQPSILAKQNAVVYDCLSDRKSEKERACLILDLPGHNEKQAGEFICYTLNNGNYHNITFSYDHTTGVPRIILRGTYWDIRAIVDAYYAQMIS